MLDLAWHVDHAPLGDNMNVDTPNVAASSSVRNRIAVSHTDKTIVVLNLHTDGSRAGA